MTVSVITLYETEISANIAAAQVAKASRITSGWTPVGDIFVVSGNNSWIAFYVKSYTPPA
jgi:hypothetical protein